MWRLDGDSPGMDISYIRRRKSYRNFQPSMGRVHTSRSFGVSGTVTHEQAMERTSTLVDGRGFGWGVRDEVWWCVANVEYFVFSWEWDWQEVLIILFKCRILDFRFG